MGEEESNKMVAEIPTPETPPQKPPQAVVEMAIAQLPLHEFKSTLPVVEEIPESPSKEKILEDNLLKASFDRDAQLTRLETEKRMSLIKAWEESEKCKAENKAHKKIAAIEAWEISKKASVEAELRKIEEKLEKKKAEYAEQMKNRIAMLHKEAEEKKAMVEAKRGQDVLNVEEMAGNYRESGKTPKNFLVCFKRCG